MSHDTVSSVTKASGGVHEQIESFLQAVMEGLMHPDREDARAARQAGPPLSLPSVTLWMVVLVAVLRGLCVSTGDLAVIGGWRLVEAAKLRYWRSSRLQAAGARGMEAISSGL